MFGRFLDRLGRWFDSRLDLSALLRAEFTARLAPAPPNPVRAILDNLGFINAVLFVVVLISGLALVFQYRPSVSDAFASTMRMEHQLAGLWLARRFHAVGANLLVLNMFLHMVRVVANGAYKDPRELNWLSGFLLFSLGLAMIFTGYLLPMNQAGYWRVMAVTGWLREVPFLGEWLAQAGRGGDNLGQAGLSLFYGLHLFLPFVMLPLLALHLWLLRRLGVAEPI